MLTEFGKFTRKLRIDRGELLKDMARKLDVTVAYLSAVEVGRRKIPEKWLLMISQLYNLQDEESQEMRHAYDQSVTEIKIDLVERPSIHREAAMMFARELKNLDESCVEDLIKRISQANKGKKG